MAAWEKHLVGSPIDIWRMELILLKKKGGRPFEYILLIYFQIPQPVAPQTKSKRLPNLTKKLVFFFFGEKHFSFVCFLMDFDDTGSAR